MSIAIEQIRLKQALALLQAIGMPPQQQNQRSACCLLALLNLSPEKDWHEAAATLIGISPIMDWVQQHYKISYAQH